MFVAIEGLDGVGKTTLVDALARRLGGEAMSTPGAWFRTHTNQVLSALGEDQSARCLFYAATVLSQGRRARESAGRHIVVMDRYWLSTIAYARARGVALDVSAIESVVPEPDVTVLVTLDEPERLHRLRSRAGSTQADIESIDGRFRATVLQEMRSEARRPELRPIEIDVTGAGREEAARRVEAALLLHGTSLRPKLG